MEYVECIAKRMENAALMHYTIVVVRVCTPQSYIVIVARASRVYRYRCSRRDSIV